jgi:hypothetical protein
LKAVGLIVAIATFIFIFYFQAIGSSAQIQLYNDIPANLSEPYCHISPNSSFIGIKLTEMSIEKGCEEKKIL